MDETTMRANRRKFFKAGVERVKDMRKNMEAVAADGVKLGLPDSAFAEWRAALNRQEKGFQSEVDKLN